MPTITRRMNTITRCFSTYRSEKLGIEELGGCHHSFILCISKNPGMSQDQISRHLSLNKSTVTRALTFLEERGYVRRETAKEDKRQLLVYPTDKMLLAFPRVQKINAEWNCELTDGISEEELEVFNKVLTKLECRAKNLIEESERAKDEACI